MVMAIPYHIRPEKIICILDGKPKIREDAETAPDQGL